MYFSVFREGNLTRCHVNSNPPFQSKRQLHVTLDIAWWKVEKWRVNVFMGVATHLRRTSWPSGERHEGTHELFKVAFRTHTHSRLQLLSAMMRDHDVDHRKQQQQLQSNGPTRSKQKNSDYFSETFSSRIENVLSITLHAHQLSTLNTAGENNLNVCVVSSWIFPSGTFSRWPKIF